MAQVAAPLQTRLRAYQAVRFPVAAYLPMVAAAAAAALLFSRAARRTDGGPGGAVPAAELLGLWPQLVIGALSMLGFFFLLRVLDEHKDADVDARYRPELPVPSGLVRLAELRRVAGAVVAVLAALNAALDPALLLPLLLVLAWAGLMGREFFVGAWLRRRPLWYLLSHMVVMPLIFLHATALDWLAADASMPAAVWIFLAFAFLNGLVIEIGRKLRAPADEREGVETYTAAWGIRVAGAAWVASLAGAAATAVLALRSAGARSDAIPAALVVLAILAAFPALGLMTTRRPGAGGRVELAAGVWVLASYVVVAVGSWTALT